MITTTAFLHGLEQAGISFVTGVPDSLLKHIGAHITDVFPPDRHIIATNEGSAVGLAIGHYLATAAPALVYMQNSGLGNAINPLTSLADPDVYGLPMLLMVGWRGELLDDGTQLRDEPQHKKQGRITPDLLETLGIPFRVVDQNTLDIAAILRELTDVACAQSRPVAMVVRKGTFAPYPTKKSSPDPLPSREEAIRAILETLPTQVPVVSTTGMASREVFELRREAVSGHGRDFLTVGGMGHAGQIAAGIALASAGRKIVCIDGDGAALMHLGALAVSAECPNLIHVVINNMAHDSVGGQPTKAVRLKLTDIARALGYQHFSRVDDLDGVRQRLAQALASSGSVFLEVRCRQGARKGLGRPDRTPVQNKLDFMMFLQEITA